MDDRHFYAFDEAEFLREQLEQNKEQMEMIDLGAGSKKGNAHKKQIAQVAKNSLSSAWQCQMMFKLVDHLQSEQILEIGSSLGISSIYLAKANGKSSVQSLEGNHDSITIAKNMATRARVQNVHFTEGNFNDTLASVLKKMPHVDLAFVDGNHRYEATVDYTTKILAKAHASTAIVIDDIYWSEGMTKAWKEIIGLPQIKASVDFFYFGIVFTHPVFKENKNLKIIEPRLKPWQKYI